MIEAANIHINKKIIRQIVRRENERKCEQKGAGKRRNFNKFCNFIIIIIASGTIERKRASVAAARIQAKVSANFLVFSSYSTR
jgi:hypothetical protein